MAQGLARLARVLKVEIMAVFAQACGQLLTDGDGLPALGQHHHQIQIGQRRAKTQRLCHRHRRQHMGGVDHPRPQKIAGLRPGALPQQAKLQPLLGGKAQFAGKDQGGCVDQRHIAKGQ